MQTWIYKGNRKQHTYLYIENRDDFSPVPDALLDLLGELKLVIDLQLDPDRPLAQADVHQVMAQIADQGFYLQMPPGEHRNKTPC